MHCGYLDNTSVTRGASFIATVRARACVEIKRDTLIILKSDRDSYRCPFTPFKKRSGFVKSKLYHKTSELRHFYILNHIYEMRNNDILRQNYDILAHIWIKSLNYLSEVGATYSIKM